MELLDINLTKLKSFAPCYSQSLLPADFKENHILYSDLKNPCKNICETRNLKSSMNSILYNGKMREDDQTKTLGLRRLDFLPRKLDKNRLY
jgi:hypothetical protein